MKIIGITGGSGSGKGEFCKVLSRCGIPALDTDITARKVVEKGKPCLEELRRVFGDGIISEDGTLLRKVLAKKAFSDEKLHGELNRITHYYIIREVLEWIDEQRKNGSRAAAIDAPLLFESGLDKICDMTLAVVAPKKVRIDRIIERDGEDRESAALRISAQKTEEEYKKLCDYTVLNDEGLSELAKKAEEFAKKILGETE